MTDTTNSNKRILVVDDVAENIKVIGTVLRDNGYLVTVAFDGHQALDIVNKNLPDLILLDILMPGINGFETCRKLKKDPALRDIPVIFMSALSEAVDKVTGFKVGGVDYLTKPVETQELLARITTHLTISQLNRELEALNSSLEEKVTQRTAELSQANADLKAEISQRQNAEEQLRKSESDLRITLNSIGDAVVATDLNSKITRMNPVAEMLVGCSLQEVKGQHINDVLTLLEPDTRKPVTDLFDKIMHPSYQPRNKQLILILCSRSGKEYLIADSCNPIRKEEDETVGMVFVFHDITETSRLEEQLKQAQKMEAIGRLAGGIAHDFNNLLTGIIGYASSLQIKLKHVAGDYSRYIDGIINTSQSASSLTEKLLTFSRKGKLQTSIFNVNDAILPAIEIIKRTIGSHIEVHSNLKAEHNIINGDLSLIQNAILNLGINSRDAIIDSGTLTLTTQNLELDQHYCDTSTFDIKPGSYIQLQIEDDGTGMPEDVLENIFEPFYTTKKVGEGTGLGLSVVYGTIKKHHGEITVSSEQGSGTTFQILLPLCSPSDD